MAEQKLALIQDAWQRYVKGNSLDVHCLRPEVARSWQRCHNLNIDPHCDCRDTAVDKLQLNHRLLHNQRLLKIARPVMERLYAFVKGTGFQVVLTDETGFLLDVLGDQAITSRAKQVQLCPGGDWSEVARGTNAIGTAIFERRPVQICAAEHYCEANQFLVCSASPIFDVDGEMVGILDLSGEYQSTNAHTLGMVVAAVGAVENQLRLQKATENLYAAYRHSSAILESISDGLVSIDNRGVITGINRKGAQIFNVDPALVQGQNIGQLISPNLPLVRLLSSGQAYENREIQLGTSGKRLNSSASLIRDEQGHVIGAVATFREITIRQVATKRLCLQPRRYSFEDIVGNSAAMSALKAWARQAAMSTSTVLIQGESGTGKELFAQAIHDASPRRDCPFVAINCAALPENLIESELFGYEDGAFTGARKGGNPGKFELADGGTLFLDEIGDMPLSVQTKVLRVLQDKRVARIGTTHEREVDIRIVAATNKDLANEVREGRFRNDLYYRLHVLDIRIPALREHSEDIPALACHMVEKISRRLGVGPFQISDSFLVGLQCYSWPGNIRELENAVERAIIRCGQQGLLSGDLLDLRSHSSQVPELSGSELSPVKSLREVEKEMIVNAISFYKGNIQKAAAKLGIGRNTLYRKMKEYDIAEHSLACKVGVRL